MEMNAFVGVEMETLSRVSGTRAANLDADEETAMTDGGEVRVETCGDEEMESGADEDEEK
jgi:hypothetical protein